jgi:IS5 family transposase
MVRGDCTVTESNIHEPADSSLLDDCVRVLTRGLHRSKELVRFSFTDHSKRARRRTIAIQYAARNAARVPLYKDLMKVATNAVRAAERAADALDKFNGSDPIDAARAVFLAADLRHYVVLTKRVFDQTHRRVMQGETVPASEKIVSIFEPHTDIIRNDNRNTFYGHKLYLSSGASGLISDCSVLDGNPTDANLAVDAVERHREVFGEAPAPGRLRRRIRIAREPRSDQRTWCGGRRLCQRSRAAGRRNGQEQLGLPSPAQLPCGR